MRTFQVMTMASAAILVVVGVAVPANADEIIYDSSMTVQLTDVTGEPTDAAEAGLDSSPSTAESTAHYEWPQVQGYRVQYAAMVPAEAQDDVPADAVVLTEQIETGRDFSVAALTWPAAETFPENATITFRVREADSWSDWLTVEPDDAGNEGQERAGTDPFITGSADAIQVALQTDDANLPGDLQLTVIYTDTTTTDVTSSSLSTTMSSTTTTAGVTQPQIITRAEWGVSNETPNWTKRYYTLQAAVIHHTAGTNNYTAAQSAGIVKGIFNYHTQSRGWGDIGYNFLVDKYGQIFEGRAGSIDSPASEMVEAGHAYGYNKGTLGISALGDYTTATPTAAIYDAYVAVIDWRFDLAGLNASDTSELYAGGYSNSTFDSGSALPRVFAHRDVGSTACPGNAIYGQISSLISRVGDASTSPYFSDVSARTTAFVTEINWMYTSRVSTGWYDNNSRVYLPWAATQRDAVAAFLYRLLGSPEYEPPTVSPFADVSVDHVFYKEIVWMFESGYSTGWLNESGIRTYRPDDQIQRDAVAAFLYRISNSPDIESNPSLAFTDVGSDVVFSKEIAWMKEAGIAIGWNDGTYRPYEPVLREQMAAFLYRWSE